MAKQKLFWRTDYQIRAPSLRVVDADGKLVGVLSVAEAISKAKTEGLTLIEIAPGAVPPVAKIADFGKFKYAEEKKAAAAAKKIKGGGVKEIRFSPFIAENDFKTRIGRIKEFFEEKNKVRVVVVFRGPQMRVKNIGFDVINKIKNEFGESIITDMPPKFLGKHLVTVLSYTAKKPNAKKANDKLEPEVKAEQTI